MHWLLLGLLYEWLNFLFEKKKNLCHHAYKNIFHLVFHILWLSSPRSALQCSYEEDELTWLEQNQHCTFCWVWYQVLWIGLSIWYWKVAFLFQLMLTAFQKLFSFYCRHFHGFPRRWFLRLCSEKHRWFFSKSMFLSRQREMSSSCIQGPDFQVV